MARPRKLPEQVKRFSLRVPVDLLKQVRHRAIDLDQTPNDFILDVIKRAPTGEVVVFRGSLGECKRYPLRIPTQVLIKARILARRNNGMSINLWLVAKLRKAVRS